MTEIEMRPATKALSITDNAAEHIKALLAAREKESAGVRVGIRTRGAVLAERLRTIIGVKKELL